MNLEPNNLDIIGKLIVAVGSIVSCLLLAIIGVLKYFLGRLVDSHDALNEKVSSHDVRLENHEQRIITLEKEN